MRSRKSSHCVFGVRKRAVRKRLNGRRYHAEAVDAPRACCREKLDGPGRLIPCLTHELQLAIPKPSARETKDTATVSCYLLDPFARAGKLNSGLGIGEPVDQDVFQSVSPNLKRFAQIANLRSVHHRLLT